MPSLPAGRPKAEHACRNNPNGVHKAGPADARGHYFCIYCGHPLVVVQKKTGQGVGLTLTLILLLAVVLGFLWAVMAF